MFEDKNGFSYAWYAYLHFSGINCILLCSFGAEDLLVILVMVISFYIRIQYFALEKTLFHIMI